MASVQDDLNRTTWSKPSSQRFLDDARVFPGEQVALEIVKEHLLGRPILNLGVGTGRTIPLLLPLTSEYRGLDYLPKMVDVCRRKFPNVRVDVGDARFLTGYPDRHFGLVNFAYNGIDAVSNSDRALVLKAARRVLAPGGMLFFSTLNLEGPEVRERPWRLRVGRTRNPLRYIARVSHAALRVPIDIVQWAKVRAMADRGAGYEVAPLSAHHYSILAHYTTLDRQIAELADAGFSRDVAVFANSTGKPVDIFEDKSHVDWFHIIARPET